MSQLIGAIVDRGEEVAQALESALALEEPPSWLDPEPRRVAVPEALAGYEVETARAADYQELLSMGDVR